MRAEGTPPARFAVEHVHYTEDLPFWSAMADGVDGPILDLAAAVGRVALHLAAQGHTVVCVDDDPDMLSELARAAQAAGHDEHIRRERADLRTLALGQTFELVLLPMNTLQAFLTREDQIDVLRAVRRHLLRDGEFVFDVVMADLDQLAQLVGVVQPGPVVEHDARELTHQARFDQVDTATGTVRFTLLIEERVGATTTRFARPHTVHLFTPSELWELLAQAGLEVRAVYGDFAGGQLEPDSERQIYRCGVAP